MTVVQNVTSSPGGPHANRPVFITLIAGANGAPGYTGSGDIVGIWTVQTDATGHWSHDFTPNDQITPANTVYQVTEEGGVSIISVPDSGGPYNLSQVLVTAPPTPSAPGITGVQVAANGTVAGVRPRVNLIAGAGVTVTAVDNPATNGVDVTVSATGGGAGTLLAANNLSDVASASTSRTNLGLGSAATQPSSVFAQTANNLSDLLSASVARTNLGLGGAATLSVGTTTGTVAAGDDSRITGAAQKSANLSDLASAPTARTNLGLGTAATQASSAFAQSANNLSDLASAATARTNLGLGGAATLNVGTAAGTVAAGNDSRITGALQAANNLSDVATPATARTNLGLGGAATLNVGTATGTVSAGDDSRITGAAQKANNLSDLASASTARTNLGLGGAATLNVGTATGTVAAGDDSRITGAAQKANNLSDLASIGAARGNLGLYVQDSPAKRGWVEWNYPILPQVAVSQNLTSGTIYGVLFEILSGSPFSKAVFQVVSSASSPVAGQNLVGYYEISGTTATQKGITADLGTWGSAGLQTPSIGAQNPAVGTTVCLLFMSNATTPVHLQGVTSDTAAQVGFLNLGLGNTAAPFLRFFVYGTAQTALPASFTISGTTMTGTNALVPFAGLSN